MKSVNVQAVYYCYDLTITNSGSFGTYGKNDDDLYYQMGLIFERLDDPIFLSNVTRETIDKIFLFNIEEIGRVFTIFSDTHAIDEMDKHGYVRENNIGLLLSGAFNACNDAEHKVENAKSALEVVEARLKKLEAEFAEIEAGDNCECDGGYRDNSERNNGGHVKKIEDAKHAMEATRARVEKRRGALDKAEELVRKTDVVRKYIMNLALDKFELTSEDALKQVEEIKQKEEEERNSEPINKRARHNIAVLKSAKNKSENANNAENSAQNADDACGTGDAVGARGADGACGADGANSADTTSNASDNYQHNSAASDPSLLKAIWG